MKSGRVFCASFLIATFASAAALHETVFADPIGPVAQDSVESTQTLDDPISPTRHLLILCGHPGDDQHRVLYAETVDRLRETLTTRFGFDDQSTTVLFGTEEMLTDAGPAPQNAEAACTQQ